MNSKMKHVEHCNLLGSKSQVEYVQQSYMAKKLSLDSTEI